MNKKEFKKKCKEEKATSCKLMLAGGIFAVLGLILVIADMIFIKTFSVQIAGFTAGGILAVIGIGLDLAGEIRLAKDYKAYSSQQ